jgi:diacylglycerol kinase family enzyme
MKKMLFVYNPRSGKGLIRNQLSTIVEMFSAANYDITVYPTKQVMDGCMTVQNRAEEFDVIVCSGGDGTLDEVVTGLMNSGIRRPIGYIPAGSTNDFASSIGIPGDMIKAAKIAVGKKSKY